MADPIHFTCGGRPYRLDPDPALRAAVVTCPDEPDVAAAVRAAAGRGRLVPPTVARTRDANEFLLPDDAVVFGGDGRAIVGALPGDADEFLRGLAGLLDDLRAELPRGPFALAADLGFVLAPGRRLTLLPGSVVHAAAADSPAAAAALARLCRSLAGMPVLGDGGAAWGWFADQLDPFADGRGTLAELAGCAADALRRVGLTPLAGPPAALPACRECGARVVDATTDCPACRKAFRTRGEYCFVDNDWLDHPRLGRKPYRVVELPPGAPVPRRAALNARLARHGDARVVDGFGVGTKAAANGAPARVLLVFSEPPTAAALASVRKAIAAVPAVVHTTAVVAPPAPPPPPPPPPPVAVICGVCQSPVLGKRVFCRNCGTAVPAATPAVAAPPTEAAPGVLLETAGAAKRWAGPAAQVIEAPEPGGCADLLAALGTATDRPPALALVLDAVRTENRLRARVDAGGGERPFAEWCRLHRADPDFHDHLTGMVADLLAALAGLHAAGWFYAAPLADRVRVAGDPPAVRLDWPLAPRRPGAVAGGRAMLGYTPPEFGHPDRPPGPDTDVFAAAAAALAGLLGRDPPPSLSRDDIGLPHLRAWVPTLPAGWGGWFETALAKRPADRFAGPAAALDTWRALTAAGTPPAGFVTAAGLHVGVGKVTSNPRNQDRVIVVPLPGEVPDRTGFDDFPAAENYTTAEAACPDSLFVAVADGISTVSSGELAAEAVTASLATQAAGGPTSADPGPTLAGWFEAANADLGRVIAATGRADLTTAAGYPSATLAAALFTPARAAAANLGDSRVYLLRAGVLDQLTVDGDEGTRHLLGGADADAALGRDDAKELVGWVGRFASAGGHPARIDPARPVRVTAGPGFSALSFRPRAGDVYCCCSDGVSDYADAGVIDLAAVLAELPPAEACRHLVAAANAAGGGDNISVVVARALAPADPPPPPARTAP